jgi:hypothetical protein
MKMLKFFRDLGAVIISALLWICIILFYKICGKDEEVGLWLD